jgi:hypothetical protein
MSVPLRLSLLALTIVAPAFLIVQLELGEASWRDCFARLGSHPTPNDMGSLDAWRIALDALTRPSKEALLVVATPMLPALAAIALARRPGLPLVALAPVLFVVWLVGLDPSNLHHCDRKGTSSIGVAFLMLLFSYRSAQLYRLASG